VLGRTAAASAMMFMLSIEAVTEDPGSAIIIVSVRLLDSEFLKELSERNLIDGARQSRLDAMATRERVIAFQGAFPP
jgi:hypothetical protein